MKNFCKLLTLAACLSLSPNAHSATAILGASKDNTLFQSAVDSSGGGAAGIFAGATGTGSPRRALIAFDVAGSLPSGATITSVQFTLHLALTGGGSSQSFALHRLTADWGEGTAGDSLPTVMNSGQGFPAAAGDATWNARFYSSTPWTSPGATGDFAATASASALVAAVIETPYSWLSTPAMVSDVQSWLSNPATNFGWALVAADEATRGTARAFYSREATLDASGDLLDLGFRPALTIEYSVVPEPRTAILLAGLSLVLVVAGGRVSRGRGRLNL